MKMKGYAVGDKGDEMQEKEKSSKCSLTNPILPAVRYFEAKKSVEMKSSDSHGNSNRRGRGFQAANEMQPTRKLLAGLPCDEKPRDNASP